MIRTQQTWESPNHSSFNHWFIDDLVEPDATTMIFQVQSYYLLLTTEQVTMWQVLMSLDNSPNNQIAGTPSPLPGLRTVPSGEITLSKTTVAHYRVSTGINNSHTRGLYFALHSGDIIDNKIKDDTVEYLNDTFSDLFSSVLTPLQDYLHRELTFEGFDNGIYHRNGYRYPTRGLSYPH